jgi:hypothetical protein
MEELDERGSWCPSNAKVTHTELGRRVGYGLRVCERGCFDYSIGRVSSIGLERPASTMGRASCARPDRVRAPYLGARREKNHNCSIATERLEA